MILYFFLFFSNLSPQDLQKIYRVEKSYFDLDVVFDSENESNFSSFIPFRCKKKYFFYFSTQNDVMRTRLRIF